MQVNILIFQYLVDSVVSNQMQWDVYVNLSVQLFTQIVIC